MKKKVLMTISAGFLASAILFSGMLGFGKVYAQATTPEATEAAPAQPADYDTALAEKLGITAEEMQTARTAAFEAAVDQALKDETLTQAQADQLKARPGIGYDLLGRFIGQDELAKIDWDQLLADALKITKEELNNARATVDADRIAQMVKDGQLTQEEADQMAARQKLMNSTEFQADLKAGVETALKNAVEAGTITQAEADAILAQYGSFTDFGFGMGNRLGFGPGFGMGFGRDDRGFGQRQGAFDRGMQGGMGDKPDRGGMYGNGLCDGSPWNTQP